MATRSSPDWNPSPTAKLTRLPSTLNTEPGPIPTKGFGSPGLRTPRYFSNLVTPGRDRTCSAIDSDNPGKKTRITFPLLEISNRSSCASEGLKSEVRFSAGVGVAPVTTGVAAFAAVGPGGKVVRASCSGEQATNTKPTRSNSRRNAPSLITVPSLRIPNLPTGSSRLPLPWSHYNRLAGLRFNAFEKVGRHNGAGCHGRVCPNVVLPA